MAKNPFNTAAKAIGGTTPTTSKKAAPKPAAKKASGTSRQATIDANRRRDAAAKSRYPAKPSTNKGGKR
jgi:hypothetical protein